ncbi:hypothetical protein [Shimia isoporae]|nr:hypothetical protein [Shimia isoporae]
MGQNWRLGDFDDTGPFMPEREDSAVSSKPRKEVHRLMIEAARRTVGAQANEPAEPKISRVEAAMQRNAPELAGAPAAELALIEAERDALMARRWPRPRLLSLIMVGTVALVMPAVAIRLLIWSLILFIVAAVAVGPERVRDALRGVGLWCMRYWQHELRLAQKFVSGR